MNTLLFDYYLNIFEVIIILILLGGVGGVACWRLWRGREAAREAIADTLAKYDPAHHKALHDHLHAAIAHEVVRGLDHILNMSVKTLEGLGEEQNILRDKQNKIVAKAHDMTQHASNILDVFTPGPDKLQMDLLSIRRVVESVLSELFSFADSRGVVLRQKLEDVGPTALDRDATLVALNNVIHNAIKYSSPGDVVTVVLFLDNPQEGAKNMICVEVKDTGKGISEEDQGKIFDLKVRGNGLIQPGSGLGLYLAREAARRQGGDVILVSSSVNQGSVFRIILPYVHDDLSD